MNIELSDDFDELGSAVLFALANDSDLKVTEKKTGARVSIENFKTLTPSTAEYTFNKTINGNLVKDVNMKSNAGWSQWAGPDNRHIYPSNPNYTSTPAYYLTNTNKGYGWIFVLSAKAQPLRNLNITASYTRTEQYEVTGMPGSDRESVFKSLPTVDGPAFATLQPSQYYNPHRLMASVSYKMPWGTNVSLFYQGYVPTGSTFQFDNDANGDSNITDLIYVPKTKDEILFVSDQDRDNFWAFVEQDAYLSSRKGKYAMAYGAHRPMVHYFDLKLAQDFKIRLGSTTNTIQLSADIMNVGNLINDSWGVIKTWDDSAKNGQILTFDHLNENGQPVFSTPLKEGAKTWKPSTGIGQAWYIQLGLKYMFN